MKSAANLEFAALFACLKAKLVKWVSMTPEEQVQIIAEIASRNSESEQEIYHLALTSRGVTLNEAQDSYRLVQIAFGRFLMKDLGIQFSPDYWRFSEAGQHLVTEKLSDNAVFLAAQTLSSSLMIKPVISALALTSPELRAVNDLMKQGSKSADLALAPVVLFEGRPNNEAIEKAGKQMRQHLNDIPYSVKSKPWWKVW